MEDARTILLREVMRVDSGPVRPCAVYMRLKRPRCSDHDYTTVEEAGPLSLRVRLESPIKGDGTAMSKLASHVGECGASRRQQTLLFHLLRKAEQGSIPETRQVVEGASAVSSASALSVRRIWDLRRCVVLDCAALDTEEKFPTEDSASSDTHPGSSGKSDWLLYMLDRSGATMEVENEAHEADEFSFDDLYVTPLTEEMGIMNTASTRSVQGHRKRLREEMEPHFVLSIEGALVMDGETKYKCPDEYAVGSSALEICSMLREHGQDCFFLDEGDGFDPELYLYPDHRKDDEYDSNAADCSANEYPEESSSEDSYTDDGDEDGLGVCGLRSVCGRGHYAFSDAAGGGRRYFTGESDFLYSECECSDVLGSGWDDSGGD
ncbi:hypothetical protein ERJ75_001536700 [Trypanosoma vivax]|uniref:Transcription factor Iwr1 domain-containing protein n=1 Tax=Trypanosoma vivax (strain Y486) TaxID=1055687 RepID=G0U7Z3_TRYVY|nr:hypothetical protein TRVL_01781 [Trypanosoma vivax]KAH8606215.1 hypothetical protein ERJ75_001536700 [Trypanosoma vivax]CCC52001.1 conserved hypothetical protein [Trypanosoma vivax Y486]